MSTSQNIVRSNSLQRDASNGEREKQLKKEPSSQQQTPDVPPNGGYGWVIVFGVFLVNAHSWGINSSYGVFLAYYLANDYFPGATYLQFAFVGGLSISMALFIAPVATNTTRLFGTRVTLLVGVFFETLALIGASFATKIWHLFLSQGLCFGWGMGFLFVGSVGLVPQWFSTRRSFANAIGAAGSGIGGLIYSLATNAIIHKISLPWAFRILGILAFGVNTICAIILKDRNKQVGTAQVAVNLKLFKRSEFLMIEMWGFFSMLGYIVLLFSLPNYATSIGLSASQGSLVGALLNLGQGLGRPPVGYFSDVVGRLNMATLTTFLAGVFALAIWIPANSFGVLIFFAIIGGAVAGTFWATIGPVSAEVIGLKDLPAALSTTWVFISVPCTFAEPIALEIAQRSNAKYLGAQLFAGFMYIAAALCLLCARTWKIRELDRLEAEESDGHVSGHSKAKPRSIMSALLTWKKV